MNRTDTDAVLPDSARTALMAMARDMHCVVEESVLQHPATREGPADAWLEKQRLLLADMAIHLLQTALGPSELERDKLRNNVHAILTIADQFLPHAGLKQATSKLYVDEVSPGT